MKVADNVGITYVNTVIGRGVLNNVVNLTLGAFNFTPAESADGSVDVDMVIAARLRMDLVCARNLYEVLGGLLSGIDAANLNGADAPVLTGEPAQSNEKPN